MPNISRKMGITIGVIVVAVLVTSVGYYELATPSVHYGFISMSKASSTLNATFTSEGTNATAIFLHDPVLGSSSYKGVLFSGTGSYGYLQLGIAEGYYNSTSSANGFYYSISHNVGYKYNQTYRGFTFSYMNFTVLHLGLPVHVVAVNGNYVVMMNSDGNVANAGEVLNLSEAQFNAMS